MENPFRSEQGAFQLLLITLPAFVLIAVASWISAWLGLAVFLALSFAVLVYFVRAREERPAPQPVPHRGATDERRIVVIADEELASEELVAHLREQARGVREEVLVVAPALNTAGRQLASDVDGARADAAERLRRSLDALAREGIAASGQVGAADPIQALDDALRSFGADEIVIVTPPRASHWHESRVVERARERYDVVVRHVVVEPDA